MVILSQASEGMDGGGGSLFGVLDLLMLGGMAGAALYWFVFRKKKEEEQHSFKPLKVQ